MNILNNNGPIIESCGISREISEHFLYEELIPMLSETKVV